jgi:hypothetical protein
VGNLSERDHLENGGVVRRIIQGGSNMTGTNCDLFTHNQSRSYLNHLVLKWTLEKWDGEHGLDRSCSGYGQVAGCCECGNETSGFIKCGKFID